MEISHELLNESDKKAEVSLVSRLCDGNGKQVLEVKADAQFAPGECKTISLNGCVNRPKLWSPENPELYVLSTCFSVNGGKEYKVFSEKQESAPSVSMRTKAFPEWGKQKNKRGLRTS